MHDLLIFLAGAAFALAMFWGCAWLDRYEDEREREFFANQDREGVVDRARDEPLGNGTSAHEKSQGADANSAPILYVLDGDRK